MVFSDKFTLSNSDQIVHFSGYRILIPRPQAALVVKPDTKPDPCVCLEAEVGDKTYYLVHLSPKRCRQLSIDMVFSDKFTLSATNQIVHFSGYRILKPRPQGEGNHVPIDNETEVVPYEGLNTNIFEDEGSGSREVLPAKESADSETKVVPTTTIVHGHGKKRTTSIADKRKLRKEKRKSGSLGVSIAEVV